MAALSDTRSGTTILVVNTYSGTMLVGTRPRIAHTGGADEVAQAYDVRCTVDVIQIICQTSAPLSDTS